MQGKSIMTNSVKIVLCLFLLLVLVQAVQAAETYVFVTKWGTQGSGNGQFEVPMGVAIDSSGNVYVADFGNFSIKKFSSTGTFLTKWGSYGVADGQFFGPIGVAVDSSGNVYVVDRNNCRIKKFSSTGTFLTKWGSGGWSGDGQFYSPQGIAVDSSGNVYVADASQNRIQKFSSTGTFLAKWGSDGSADGQFEHPVAVAVDSSGNVYVADGGNNRVQKFSSTGTFLAKWGSFGAGDGQFFGPSGVAVDSSGNVYVADGNNNRVQKFSSTGTFLAKWGSLGSGDGQFNGLCGIAVDSSGNVYVADYLNNRIQKFAVNNIVAPILTSPLDITPTIEPCQIGKNLTAKFSITNTGDAPIILDKLLVRGKLNDGTLPIGDYPDFTSESVTLQPHTSHDYSGNITLSYPGNYHFFVAYYIANPTPEEKQLLDANNWNTAVDLGPGLTDQDRIKNIIKNFNASDYAKELLGARYLYGAKGFDMKSQKFLNSSQIKSGYFWNDNNHDLFSSGLDCSGLIFWVYNMYLGTKNYDDNFPIHAGSDGQYHQSDIFYNKEALQPGDLIFFDVEIRDRDGKFIAYGQDKIIDHVAMYVGDYQCHCIIKNTKGEDVTYNGIFNVVEARGSAGVIPVTVDTLIDRDRELIKDGDAFKGFGHLNVNAPTTTTTVITTVPTTTSQWFPIVPTTLQTTILTTETTTEPTTVMTTKPTTVPIVPTTIPTILITKPTQPSPLGVEIGIIAIIGAALIVMKRK